MISQLTPLQQISSFNVCVRTGTDVTAVAEDVFSGSAVTVAVGLTEGVITSSSSSIVSIYLVTCETTVLVGSAVGTGVATGVVVDVGSAGALVGTAVGSGSLTKKGALVRVGNGFPVTLGSVVGTAVGVAVGAFVGVTVGFLVGVAVGAFVGVTVGFFVGVAVGAFVGVAVGFFVGVAVGAFVGVTVGFFVGVAVGAFVGVTVGFFVGVGVGVDILEPKPVGPEGIQEGFDSPLLSGMQATEIVVFLTFVRWIASFLYSLLFV